MVRTMKRWLFFRVTIVLFNAKVKPVRSNYQESATSVALVDHNYMTVSLTRSSSFITAIVQFDLSPTHLPSWHYGCILDYLGYVYFDLTGVLEVYIRCLYW